MLNAMLKKEIEIYARIMSLQEFALEAYKRTLQPGGSRKQESEELEYFAQQLKANKRFSIGDKVTTQYEGKKLVAHVIEIRVFNNGHTMLTLRKGRRLIVIRSSNATQI